jgi:hypothetical protein
MGLWIYLKQVDSGCGRLGGPALGPARGADAGVSLPPVCMRRTFPTLQQCEATPVKLHKRSGGRGADAMSS